MRTESPLKLNSAEEGLYFRNFCLSLWYLCQVEGHGETLSKFSLKFTKNFPRQIWKIFSGFIYLRPLYRNILLIRLDTQWERLWHFWTTVFWFFSQSHSFSFVFLQTETNTFLQWSSNCFILELKPSSLLYPHLRVFRHVVNRSWSVREVAKKKESSRGYLQSCNWDQQTPHVIFCLLWRVYPGRPSRTLECYYHYWSL